MTRVDDEEADCPTFREEQVRALLQPHSPN
jgi:hypothetical protein